MMKKSNIPCSFPECRNTKMLTMDICASHRAQFLRKGHMSPLRTKPARVIDGRKLCVWCKETLPVQSFRTYKLEGNSNKNKYYPACTGCEKEYHKYTAIKTKYKLTRDQYDTMILNGCEVCGETCRLVVDHDHSCCEGDYSCGDCVRGILCSECNVALGYLKDSPTIIAKLIKYLTKHGNEKFFREFPEMTDIL